MSIATPVRLSRRRIARTLAVASTLAVLTGVGTAVTSSAASAHATSRASAGLVVSALVTKTYGTILVGTSTVYTLKPSKVACAAKCLTYWPEVLLPKGSTKLTAGHGVNRSKLGTLKRAGGRLQVTYAGKALYYFAHDTKPGQVKGVLSDTWGKL